MSFLSISWQHVSTNHFTSVPIASLPPPLSLSPPPSSGCMLALPSSPLIRVAVRPSGFDLGPSWNAVMVVSEGDNSTSTMIVSRVGVSDEDTAQQQGMQVVGSVSRNCLWD